VLKENRRQVRIPTSAEQSVRAHLFEPLQEDNIGRAVAQLLGAYLVRGAGR
jgi:hypothetical protein